MIQRSILLLLILLSLGGSVMAQNPVPTLVPPTLVPDLGAIESERVVSQSAVNRIVDTGRVRVGILFNEPPFGELNIRGEIIGLDADLAQALADAWGVELRLRQVTRQTAEEQLERGAIDMLLAAQVHFRDLDEDFEFSQTYFLGNKSMMVRADDPAQVLDDMANRRVGVVLGTPAETALNDWTVDSGIPVEIVTYLTQDRLYGALRGGDVDGMVGSYHRLLRVSAVEPEATRILSEPIQKEPYAAAFNRQDVNMRNLVNKTLQYLHQQGRLNEITQVYFPQTANEVISVWDNVGDEAPKPDQFLSDIRFPSQYTIPRMQNEGVVRVAGIRGLTADDQNVSSSDRRIEIFHRNMIDAMASRWGVQVQYIPATPEEAINLVANGEADLALGIKPDWNEANRVDYTEPYMLRGYRLMVPTNSQIYGFPELRGSQIIGIELGDQRGRSIAQAEADRANAIVRFFETREEDFAFTILEDNNADVIFADSVQLLPYLEQFPEEFRLTDDWYSSDFMAMAVPQNDLDFRLLVNYTIQELMRDGVMLQLLRPVMALPEGFSGFDIWPGENNSLGITVGF